MKLVFGRRYPLEHMALVHRYIDRGPQKGNAFISVERNYKIRQSAVTSKYAGKSWNKNQLSKCLSPKWFAQRSVNSNEKGDEYVPSGC
jgi:hypothetical protein